VHLPSGVLSILLSRCVPMFAFPIALAWGWTGSTRCALSGLCWGWRASLLVLPERACRRGHRLSGCRSR
jgi:hypothetical protein